MSDAPKKQAEHIDDFGRETDAFGDRQKNVMSQRIRRGAATKVTVSIIHDDGRGTLDPLTGRITPATRQAGHYVVVSVYSLIKPGVIKQGELPLNQHNAAGMRKQVNLMGGLLAELLCEEYGDKLDPDECARAASEAWTDTMSAANRL